MFFEYIKNFEDYSMFSLANFIYRRVPVRKQEGDL